MIPDVTRITAPALLASRGAARARKPGVDELQRSDTWQIDAQRRSEEDDEPLRGESGEQIRGIAPDEEDIDDTEDELEDEEEDDQDGSNLARRRRPSSNAGQRRRRVICAWLRSAATPPRGRRASTSATLPTDRRVF